jgi:hypothetical protein
LVGGLETELVGFLRSHGAVHVYSRLVLAIGKLFVC